MKFRNGSTAMRLRTRYLALLLLAVPVLGAGGDNHQAVPASCNSCPEHSHCYAQLNALNLEDSNLTEVEQLQIYRSLKTQHISSFSDLDSHLGQLPEILAGVSDAAVRKFEAYHRIRWRQLRSMPGHVKMPTARLCTACPLHCPVMTEKKCNAPGNHHAMEVYRICSSTCNGKRLTYKQMQCRCDKCGIRYNPKCYSTTCMVGCRGCHYTICMSCANGDEYHGSQLFQQESAFRKEIDDYAYGVPAMDMLGWIMDDATYKQHLAFPVYRLAVSIRQALFLHENPEEEEESDEVCPDCDGAGEDEGGECETCDGTGEVNYE